MKFTKEIKVGFLAIIGVMMSVFSYNYLKGINLFDKNRKFTVKYEKVDGLSVSNPVTMNGFKIGKVQKINFNSKNTRELLVDITIDNDVVFPKTSLAELYETGLIGGKAIAIIPDYKNDSTTDSKKGSNRNTSDKKTVTVKLKKDKKSKKESGKETSRGSKNTSKSSKNDTKKSLPRSSSKSKKKPSVEVKTLNQAAKRAKKAPKPAKGVWGIIKSMLPRFNKE